MSRAAPPHPTTVLIARLRRAAVAFDKLAAACEDAGTAAKWRAHANVCWQAAGRLVDLAALSVPTNRLQEFIEANK